MRRLRLTSLMFVVVILLFGGFAPLIASAQEATPVLGDDLEVGHGVAAADGLEDDDEDQDHAFTCSEESRQAGLEKIVEQPWPGGVVSPASAPGQDLYFVEVTVPAGTCVGFDDHFPHDGAIIWYVKQGDIVFGIDFLEGSPPPDLALVSGNGTVKPLATSMKLTTGDSLSSDRAVGYAYRNDSKETVIILMTVLENRWIWTGAEFSPIPAGDFNCRGVCRNARR